MSDKQCPLCGKPVNDDESFCSDCSESAKKRVSLDIFEDEEPVVTIKTVSTEIKSEDSVEPEEDITERRVQELPNEPKKTNKKRIFLLLSLLVLFVAICIGLLLLNKRYRESRDAELAFWYSCIEQNTPLAYSKYLLVYPEGDFQKEAQRKITELRQTEKDNWLQVKKSSDVNDYYSFLNKYPDTPFKNEVKYLMDSLSWGIAQKENTAESYQTYIENCNLGNISGYYSSMAKERYDYLKNIKIVEGEELDNVKNAISAYFKALSGQKFSNLSKIYAPVISDFYGEKNHTSTVIIKSMQADIKKNSIKSLTYTPDFDSFSVLQDSTGLYFTDLKVEKKFSYKTNKTTEVINENLRIELTPQFEIKGMFINIK